MSLLEQQFQSACIKVKEFKSKPTDDEMLQLYSLFKQACNGDIDIQKPSDIKGKQKWEAWHSKQGMSPDEAKSKYVELVGNLSPKYA